MTRTAEIVAAEAKISRDEIDRTTMLRHDQYDRALEDDRAFQRRYMIPVEIPTRRGEPTVVDADTGVHPTTLEGLAALQPVEGAGSSRTAARRTRPTAQRACS